MAKAVSTREKWTLSFDAKLKAFLVRLARRRRTYPVAVLEGLVRERFNPYGHTDIKDSAAYVRMLRRRSRRQPDAAFLKEIRAWQRSVSS
ncbi:MAG: hypothetical protein AAB265_12890 [candidate division NC10 bacterium]|jgi:hypothetical protein